MNEAAQILVIILSTVLAVFLVLAIILVVKLIGVSNEIKAMTSSIRRTSESIESAVSSVAKVVSPMMIFRSIKEAFGKIKKKEEKNDE
jgi:cell division protein FtsL